MNAPDHDELEPDNDDESLAEDESEQEPERAPAEGAGFAKRSINSPVIINK